MRNFLLLLISLISTLATAQTYTVVIDGRLPPGQDFSTNPSTTNWGDGTTTVQGGNVNFQFRNWDPNVSVQFFEEIPNRTFTQLTLRTVYFPVPSGCTPPSPNFISYPVNLLIPIPTGGGGGLSYCQANFTVRAVPEMTITGTTGTICAGGTISLKNTQNFPDEAYTWRFRVRNPVGTTVGAGRIDPSLYDSDLKGASFNMIDLLGVDLENNIGNTIDFFLGEQNYFFSSLVSVVLDDCTPLLDERYPENALCSNAEDGAVELAFQRGLDTSENERLFIEFNDTPDGFTIPAGNDYITSLSPSSNGPNTHLFENLAPGTYQIQYQSEIDPDGDGNYEPNGLGIPFNFEILAPSEVQIDDVVLDRNPNCPSEFGERTVQALGGREYKAGQYRFTKDGGSNWDIPPDPNSNEYTYDNLIPGNDYTFGVKLVFTDGSGECVSADSVDQTIPDIPNPIMLAGGSGVSKQPSNAGATEGIIFAQVTNGSPNFTFELYSVLNPNNPISSTPPQVGRTHEFLNLGVGFYFLKVRDSNGCEVDNESTPFELAAAALPTLGTPSTTVPSCNDGTDGGVLIDVSYPTETTLSYQLRDGVMVVRSGSIPDTTAEIINITNLASGNYFLYVISATGDFTIPTTVAVSEEIIVTNPVSVSIDSFAPNDTSCFGAEDGSISVTVSGGTSYEYSLELLPGPADWFPLTGNTVENLAQGSYYLTIRNENDCQSDRIDNTNILIDDPEAIIVSEVAVGHRDVSTNGGADGAISITVSGGALGIAPAPQYTYNWIGTGPTNTTYSSNDQNIGGLIAGFYEVTVTDANGCSPINPLTIEIREPGPLAINSVTIQNEISCAAANDGVLSANVTGTSPITYEWTRDGAPFQTLIDENTISNLPPGAYQLFLNDGSRPTPLESTVLTLIAPTVITADVLATGTCSGPDAGTITISNVTGGTPGTLQDYTYSLDDGNTFQNSPLFENLTPGNYTVRVRDGNDCDFIQTDVLVAQFPAITWDAVNTEIIGVTAAGRNDGAISPVFLGGTPPFDYNWIGPGVNGTVTKDVNSLAEGNYTITVTDANGCDFDQPFEITEVGEITAIIDQSVFLECNSDAFGEITATVQGGVQPYTLEWFQTINGNDNLLPEDTEIIDDLSAGTYFLRVIDANAVTVTSTPVEILEPSLLEITLEDTIAVLCSGEATGTVRVVVSGGTPPYSYVWNNGETRQNLTGIEAGAYSLEVIDANGCFAEITATVSAAPNALQIADASVGNASEYLANDGTIFLDVTGGATPYTISWIRLSDNSTAGNQESLSALAADSYRVSISDANGCSITETYAITEPDIVEETIVPLTCNGETNGSISLLVNQGNGTFTYEWNTGATTNIIDGLTAGNYTVTITGFDNGPITRSYLIENPEPLSIDLGENRTLCVDQELVLDATVENESAIYSWSSDNGFSSDTPSVILIQTGNYTVTVTTPTGCSAQDDIFLEVSTDEIDAEFAVSSQVFVNETFVAVDISYPLPDNLEWILPDEATVLKKNGDEVELRFDTPGEYDIEIITTRGNCIAQKSKKITVVAPDGAVTKADTENGKKLIENFLVYPNPSEGKFTAEVKLTERGNVSIKAFSFANNAMMASKTDRGELYYNIPFDLSGLPAGVYAILLETPYGNTLRKVILK